MAKPLFKQPIVRGALVSEEKRDLARKLRRELTPSEAIAWELLRDRRCLGLKWRRQQVIRGYVVDFYCPELRIALEIDGSVHDDPIHKEDDEVRDYDISLAGVLVIRLPASMLTRTRLHHALRSVAAPLSREGRVALLSYLRRAPTDPGRVMKQASGAAPLRSLH